MRVPASGCVITEADKAAMRAVVDSGWLTASTQNRAFEQALSTFTGIEHVRTCNSGSSANLLAVAAMVEAGYWKPGDSIITVAAGFPTTVNPLLLYGLVPVFVDITLPSYNVNIEQLARAVNHSTRGIILAHTLGNPFNVERSSEIAMQHGLTSHRGLLRCARVSTTAQHVGTMGAIATCSFFPAHHITTGEGGAVMTQDPHLARIIESVRDWGRDCWCQAGQNNTCGKRFDQQFGGLPHGYDHKYTFTRLGFNLKLTEVQAACGLSQIGRLPEMVAARTRNFAFLRERLEPLADRLILPDAEPYTSPSWFGFPITLKEPGIRNGMQRYLDQNGVDSRLVFNGNITRQPYFAGRYHILSAELRVTDRVMNDTFWVGLHPALSEEQLERSAEMIGNFVGEFA
jgi:CDP-6-deoxy-D-xylo-4-hexulose-3-dehydrase